MADNAKNAPEKVSDAVRRAVERTVESTLGSGSQTRERAQDLVDDVLRRAEQGAARATRGVREVTDKQREAASGMGERLIAAIHDLRLATGDDVRQLRTTIERLDRRVAKLERRIEGRGATRKSPKPKSKPRSKAKPRGKSKPAK
jgi:polyhydroxyalkanoate synthesis regulator phasin